MLQNLLERQDIINFILNNEHDNECQNENQTFYISKKVYFEYQNIKDLVNNYMNNLNYKCSGLYFKNINNFSDNYLFIFPECRSDSKILNNGKTIDNEKVLENVDIDDEEEDLFKDVEIIKTENKNISNLPVKTEIKNNQYVKTNNNLKLEKMTCRFLINSTVMPDIYELYCKNSNNNIEKYSIASVPDIETSNFIKSIMVKNDLNEDIYSRIENNNAIYVECNYHKMFKKWIPYKK